ncbi:MAG: magnesium chelatase subunit D [Pseudomonadota bacterium]
MTAALTLVEPAPDDGDFLDRKVCIWSDALVALAVFALDPPTFGGITIRAHAGPVRDALLKAFRELAGEDVPVRKMPSHIADERLLGGLDMAATLKNGRPVAKMGLLSEADGGVVIVPMAERIEPLTASRLCAVLDRGEVALERDGITATLQASIGVIALDEGIGEERLPGSLADRLAFYADINGLSIREVDASPLTRTDLERARGVLAQAPVDETLFETMTALAAAFGVASMRAALFAVRTARAVAALDGRDTVEPADVELAARLVIAPRATQLPTQEAEPDALPEPQEPTDKEAQHDESPEEDDSGGDAEDASPPDGPLDDHVLEAVEAAIPDQLLEQLKLQAALARCAPQSSGGKGAQQQAQMRGRPIGSRRGRLDGRHKLHLTDTLRAAAPWQPIRKRQSTRTSKIVVTGDDIRVRRFKQTQESVTIFVVDASGSAALHRLAEVKGAVELLLAESYARRDCVALIVFRGREAELVLPPTRSLVRAKRCLAGVPGGGGTPLAAGLDAALDVALECRRSGRTPRLVVMSDAEANVGYDPTARRAEALEDALGAAKRIAAERVSALMIDTSPQRKGRRDRGGVPKALQIAEAMGGIHLALPHPSASGLKALVEDHGAHQMAS